ncbi:MAG TPA: methyltransferase domain-containing protein [Dehalococcoidia bacterium]|nr:methyltransferase domain-containing protein [Dehalococcoidia bacterium]
MKQRRYKIKLPQTESFQLKQDEAYFLLDETEDCKTIRFHDYGELYKRPGLYEQLFYDRLKCQSPQRVAQLLKKVVEDSGSRFSELRVLDVGAGNGMMGELLYDLSVARIIGVDILEEASNACERDRPGIYDVFYVIDLTALSNEVREELQGWKCNCMTCVAALGFSDIPPAAFCAAFNLVQSEGWIAFNIKETFLQSSDTSGFSMLVKNIIWADILEIYHLERYCHRESIDGVPLYYYAVIGRKKANIPP